LRGVQLPFPYFYTQNIRRTEAFLFSSMAKVPVWSVLQAEPVSPVACSSPIPQLSFAHEPSSVSLTRPSCTFFLRRHKGMQETPSFKGRARHLSKFFLPPPKFKSSKNTVAFLFFSPPPKRIQFLFLAQIPCKTHLIFQLTAIPPPSWRQGTPLLSDTDTVPPNPPDPER